MSLQSTSHFKKTHFENLVVTMKISADENVLLAIENLAALEEPVPICSFPDGNIFVLT